MQQRLYEEAMVVVVQQSRPSVLYRPVLTPHNGQWLVSYQPPGQGAAPAIAAVGVTAEEAMARFDQAWHELRVGGAGDPAVVQDKAGSESYLISAGDDE